MFEAWQVAHAGLFTFSQSAKHVGLYQKFGFWPRFLTMIMSKPLTAGIPASPLVPLSGGMSRSATAQAARFSAIAAGQRARALDECREVADSVYPGLDLEREIRAVDQQRLGDSLLLMDGSRFAGFAVCHCGAGSEAGSEACYVKFAVVRSGSAAERHFELLVKGCEDVAVKVGARRLIAGVNAGRAEAYRSLLAQGFRTEIQGVAMERGNRAGYNREGVYLIDDWR